MRGADALIAALEREGVDTVFGIPGGASLPLYDALLESSIRHVLTRHEAGAGHAAEGYARATGRVGVAFGTSGPGATNLLTPICDAYMDSTPTVFVTGQVRSDLRGTNCFQEADVIGMTTPMVKHSIAVETADEAAQAIHDAFELARTGRPGPVLVDVPSDVARAPAREHGARSTVDGGRLPGYRPRTRPNGRQVRLAAQAIAAARRPVLYAGGGVVLADAAAELTALAQLADLPVTTTLMGLGAFPASDRRFLGMLGMHGTRTANWAVDEADLIVAVGARFDDRVTGDLAQWAPHAKVVHLDVDPSEIGKLRPAHVPIVADARLGLAAIRDAYAALDATPAAAARAAWWERIGGWLAAEDRDGPAPGMAEDGRVPSSAPADRLEDARVPSSAPADRPDPYLVLDALQDATGGEAVVATDVGQHQMWAANRLRFEQPRRWLTSGGHGTMGFGLPAALGAQAALPEAQVVCVSGEGSLLMNVQELATAAEESLPVKVIVLNNRSLGMVRQQQDLFWAGRRSAVDLGSSPDWELLARAFGVAGRTVRDADDVADAIAATLAEPGPALLDVKIAPEVDALPMFAPGTAARDMLG